MRSWLLGFYVAASADGARPASGEGSIATVTRGTMLRDRFPPPARFPAGSPRTTWSLTPQVRATGFGEPAPGHRTWTDGRTSSHGRCGLTIRFVLFIGAEKDGRDHGGSRAIARFPDTLPDLRGSYIHPGCHWVQQERADEVNRLLVDWLKSLH